MTVKTIMAGSVSEINDKVESMAFKMAKEESLYLVDMEVTPLIKTETKEMRDLYAADSKLKNTTYNYIFLVQLYFDGENI